MISFKELMCNIITEEIHKELQSILDAPENDREYKPGKTTQNKLNNFTKKFRELTKNDIDTGLVDGKPKKGSSRAVFFPHTPKDINVDGQDTKQHTAVKIAFPGALDKYTQDTHLLGEHQNRVESDHFTTHNYSMLHQNEDGSYTSNPDGVTAPVFENHDQNHWLEMAHADKLTGAKFKDLTKIASHPKGLDFNKFVDTLQHDHYQAHGEKRFGSATTEAERDHIRQHPLFENTQDFIYNTGNHPGDLRLANYGVWKHPVTRKEHPVITDYGYSDEVNKLYVKAKRNSYQ